MSTFTRADIHRRALPLIFAQAAVPLAGAADTFVLGLAGTTADLGGVALGVAVFNAFYMSVYFLRMSTTGLVSQAAGADNEDETWRVLARAIAIGVVVGALVALFRSPIADLGFHILQGTSEVNERGSAYLQARAFGAPASFAVFAVTGWLIGINRTGAAFWVLGTFSAVNIVLDVVFVLVFGWGPAGVGSATAIADWAGLLVGAGIIFAAIARRGGLASAVLKPSALFAAKPMRQMFAVNLNLMVRTWMLLLAFTWFVNAGARQGTEPLAGNHILMQIIMLWAFVLDGLVFVAEAEAGRAFGAGSRAGLRRAFLITMEQTLIVGAVLAALTWFAGGAVLSAIIADEAARDAAIAFLPYCALVPILGAPSWVLDGIFIGATRGAMLRNAAAFAVVAYLAADFVLAPALGNHGVWLAFLGYYIFRAMGLGFYYPQLEARMAD